MSAPKLMKFLESHDDYKPHHDVLYDMMTKDTTSYLVWFSLRKKVFLSARGPDDQGWTSYQIFNNTSKNKKAYKIVKELPANVQGKRFDIKMCNEHDESLLLWLDNYIEYNHLGAKMNITVDDFKNFMNMSKRTKKKQRVVVDSDSEEEEEEEEEKEKEDNDEDNDEEVQVIEDGDAKDTEEAKSESELSLDEVVKEMMASEKPVKISKKRKIFWIIHEKNQGANESKFSFKSKEQAAACLKQRLTQSPIGTSSEFRVEAKPCSVFLMVDADE